MSFLKKLLTLFPDEPASMNMNTLTLIFDGKAESEYTKQKNVDYIGQKRIGLIAAIVIYAIFFVLDLAVMPEYKFFIWFVRTVFIFISILTILLTYVERVRPFMNYLISLVLVVGGIGNIIMISFAPEDVASSYYAGLILMFMLCYGVLRTNFLMSSITGLMILVSYEVTAVFFMDISKYVLLNNNFFYIAANILGIISAYKADYNSRRGFYLAYQLEEALKSNRGKPRKYVPVEVPEEIVEVQSPILTKSVDTNLVKSISEIEDITDYKKDMEDAGTTIRMLMERISDVVWYSDLDGNFMYVSPSCKKIWGYDAEKAKKMNFRDLFTKESYDYYMAELSSALESNESEIRPLDLEIICKNRVIKSGELVSIAVKDHDVYGSGIIGVIRDVSLRKSTEQELRRFNTELEELISKRTYELEDALVKLRSMEEEIRAHDKEIDEINEEEIEEINLIEEEPAIISETRTMIENNLKLVVQLKEMTKQIVKLYDIKTMKRFDLEKYFREVTKMIDHVDKSIRFTAKELSGQNSKNEELVSSEHKNELVNQSERFYVGDYIEKVFIGLGHRFQDTNHVVEILCADEIEATGKPEIYSKVIEDLVSYSLDFGLRNTDDGEIVIDVKKDEDMLAIVYKDNGNGLTDDTIKQLFKEPYKSSEFSKGINEAMLYNARGVVQNQLNGDFECKNTNEGIEFIITIPDQIA